MTACETNVRVPSTHMSTTGAIKSRLLFPVQDAGSSLNGVGGADGSAVLNANEQNWDANSFPFKFLPYVRAALSAVVCL